MSRFSELNKSFESPFTAVIPDDIEYKKLSDLDVNESYKMLACFINTKSKYGEHGVATVLDSDGYVFNASLPKHLNEVIEIILKDDGLIDEINNGTCTFHVRECTSKKYNRTFYTIDFD